MYIKIICAISIINNISDEFLILLMDDINKHIGIETSKSNSQIINEIKKQKQFLYDISFSGNIEKIINKYDELNKVYRLRGYKNNISYIEIEAIKFIREKEKEYEKTRKIKKRV